MASNVIKGLTVEIGGDTTKLGKALEDVNKKSRDISSELGDINRLLKLDPSNTELLSQKQKVLADAVANTGKKLDALKEAEKQVQEQFKKGEVSEAQVRALQREIIATEKKMESYQRATKETNEALAKHGEASKEAEEGAGNLGGTLASVAKVGFTAVATAATAAVTALVACAENTREYRTEMGKLETAFTTAGHSSEAALETYQALQGVLGETEQAVEAASHLAQLVEAGGDLTAWTDIATGVFATFGASLPIESLTEAANETAKTGQLTGALADALNWAGVNEEDFQLKLDACTTEQERQKLITDQLSESYMGAAEAYKTTNAEVIRANQANESLTASMAEIGGAVEPILTDFKMLGASILSEFVPSITALADAFRSVLNGDEGGVDAIGEALANILTQLLQKVTDLVPTLVQVAMSLLTQLTTTLLSMLPQLTTTLITIITTIIDGLVTAIPLIVQTVGTVIPQLVLALIEGIPALLDGALQLLMAIVDAVPLLIEQLAPQVPVVVEAIINGLITMIPALLEGALQLLMAIVDAVPRLIQALAPQIPSIVKTIIKGLITMLPQLLDGALELLYAIVDAVPLLIETLIPQIPSIVESVIEVLIDMNPELIQASFQLFLGLVQGLLKAIPGLVKALPQIWTAIWGVLKELPNKMLSIGGDLVRGLWTGINDMVGWVTDKISGFSDSVLDGIKSFFGVHSPSTETEWMGQMLAEGLAKGIAENASKPLDEMSGLADDLLAQETSLNGLTLDRRINTTFGAETAVADQGSGLLGKLDNILKAIEKGQILTIDGNALVGSTYNAYDNKLGQRRALVARGAL